MAKKPTKKKTITKKAGAKKRLGRKKAQAFVEVEKAEKRHPSRKWDDKPIVKSRYKLDTVIKLKKKISPFRAGSKLDIVHGDIRDGMTVGEFYEEDHNRWPYYGPWFLHYFQKVDVITLKPAKK